MHTIILIVYLLSCSFHMHSMSEMSVAFDSRHEYRFLNSTNKVGYISSQEQMIVYDGIQESSQHRWKFPSHYTIATADGLHIISLSIPDQNICDQLSHLETYNIETYNIETKTSTVKDINEPLSFIRQGYNDASCILESKQDKKAYIFDLHAKKIIKDLPYYRFANTTYTWGANYDAEKMLHVYDIGDNTCNSIKVGKGLENILWHPNNKAIATTWKDKKGYITFWNLQTRLPIKTYLNSYCYSFLPDGSFFSMPDDRQCCMCDSPIAEFPLYKKKEFTQNVRFSSCNNIFIALYALKNNIIFFLDHTQP